MKKHLLKNKGYYWLIGVLLAYLFSSDFYFSRSSNCGVKNIQINYSCSKFENNFQFFSKPTHFNYCCLDAFDLVDEDLREEVSKNKNDKFNPIYFNAIARNFAKTIKSIVVKKVSVSKSIPYKHCTQSFICVWLI
jgi:hypothetical protein